MILLTGLVGVLLVLTAEARVGKSEGTKCTETEECLLYDLLCETETYEVRRYSGVKWVSTKESSWSMDLAAIYAFGRLFDYISGENVEGKKIEMTAPVVVEIPEKKFLKSGVFTLSFLLPSEHQMNPPQANNSRVYVHEVPEMYVYVRSYGGWMASLSDLYHFHSLCHTLDMAGASYDKDLHYGVGYNSLMTLFNRHNEVWIKVRGKPVCSSSEEMMFN